MKYCKGETLSDVITAGQGLITHTFSWKDIAFATGFGELSGFAGCGLKNTKWASGVRSVLLDFGLSGLETGVGIGKSFWRFLI